MSIANQVKRAVAAFENSDYEDAFYQICSAIDATANASNERKRGGGDRYKKFLSDNMDIITRVAFNGVSIQNLKIEYDHPSIKKDKKGLCRIEDILYHAVRCGLTHETKIPSNLRFHEKALLNSDGPILQLPVKLVIGLIMAVIFSPGNSDERIDKDLLIKFEYGNFFMPIPVNSAWGKIENIRWLFECLNEAVLIERQLNSEKSASDDDDVPKP